MALRFKTEGKTDAITKTVRQVLQAMSEKDFDRMHQARAQPASYGFVDKPPLLPDIEKMVEALYKGGGGKKKVHTLDTIVGKVATMRGERANDKNLRSTGLSYQQPNVKS